MKPTLRAFPGVFLFLCLACVSPATAQTTFGSITGAVTDQTGSVIPGERVTVINEGNGAERRVETTNAGVFNVFGAAQLTSMYGNRANYLAKYDTQVKNLIRRGYLLPSDEQYMLATADKLYDYAANGPPYNGGANF